MSMDRLEQLRDAPRNQIRPRDIIAVADSLKGDRHIARQVISQPSLGHGLRYSIDKEYLFARKRGRENQELECLF